jgi:putative membrane protein
MRDNRVGNHNFYVDHSANERTFLAWIRTALSIVAVALVLARLRASTPLTWLESRVTDAIAALGILVVLGATLKYLRTRARIRAGEDPEHGIPLLDLGLAVAVFAMMAALAATSFV